MLPQVPGACLVPCGPDKAPLEKSWQQKGYTAQEIAKMGDRVKAVGINTAKAMYVCIDLDGVDAFDFCQERGLPLPDTWVIGRSNDDTRMKRVYSVTEETKKRLPLDNGKWKKGNLEVFWRSQQFIAMGEHPSGGSYTWDGSPEGVAPLPEEWLEFLPHRKEQTSASRTVREIDLKSLLTKEHEALVDNGLGGEGDRNNKLFSLAADAFSAEDEAKRRQSIDVRVVGTAQGLIETALARTPKHNFSNTEIQATLRSAREGRSLVVGFEDRWAYNVRGSQRAQLFKSPSSGNVRDIPKMQALSLEFPDQHDEKGKKMQLDSGMLSTMLTQFLPGRLAYNELGYKVELDGEPMRDADRIALLCALQNRGYKLSDQMLSEALLASSMVNQYHPVRDYLAKVLNDPTIGTVELDLMAWEFLGAEGTLAGEQLKRTLIGAVARAMQPGCKMDYICVLQGEQGLGKTTFWQLLFGPWFKVFNAELGDKDSYIGLHDSWGIELGEIDGITSVKQSAKLKNFATTQTDVLRPPYGRVTERFDRPSILVGSCNRDDFLNDSTGERRYWVIPMTKMIDRDELLRFRDAIWRTAALMWKRGELPCLSPDLEAESAENNKGYSQESPIAAPLRKHLEQNYKRGYCTKSKLKQEVAEWDLVPPTMLDKHIKSTIESIGWQEARKTGRPRFWLISSMTLADLTAADYDVLNRDVLVSNAGRPVW